MRPVRRTATRMGALLSVLAVGGLLTSPPSVAQPLQDSVTGAESTPFFTGISFDAHSGPTGENATGQVTAFFTGTRLQGAVRCLAVNGNVAVVNMPVTNLGIGVTFQVTDSPNGAPDIIEFTSSLIAVRAPDDCSPVVGGSREVAFGGQLVVVDAEPFPTSKEQCKNGGWVQFGFRNQGQCVAFVQHRPHP